MVFRTRYQPSPLQKLQTRPSLISAKTEKMSKTIQITSSSHFNSLLQSSKIVVADFYADWCAPCKQIAPLYETLSAQLSRPNKITFVKVNTDVQKDVAQKYDVRNLPTFIIYKNKEIVESMQGADPRKLAAALKKLAAEAESDDANGFGTSSGAQWTALDPPKGYSDVTEQVEIPGLDLLNSDGEFGPVKILFNQEKPSSLSDTKGKKPSNISKDWIESDTDEQLMLFVPFMSSMKIHSLFLTSLPPKDGDDVPMRPKVIKFYTNRAHVLGFDEAEDVDATQSITLRPEDWDEKTGTARVELRFVKFQSVKSLVIFVVEGEGDGEKVRIDRIRFVGDTGEKRDQGKLEKIGDE